jgi:Asp-tRNA(Asn)/Glu-tRNA(Gln) amidotransferase A subunit family amidase
VTSSSEITDLTNLRGSDLIAGYRAHHFCPSDVVGAVLDRIAETGDKHNAFITVCAENARTAAAELDTVMMRNPDRIVTGFGVPITVKDISATAGIRTTRGAARTAGWVPDFDAEAVGRLRAAGAIVVGKTNTSEAAWKAEGANPTFGASFNPWAPALTPGGSSGGAGVATAMRYGVWATGTDGFGSIRVPASYCHVVGFKPTLGSVPYVPVGPLTRTVADVRDAYLLMAGPDPRDPLATNSPQSSSRRRPLTFGALREVDGVAVAPPVSAAFDQFVAWIGAQGHPVRDVRLPVGGGDIIGPILAAFTATELAGEDTEELAHRDPDLVALVATTAQLSAAELATAQSRRIDYLHRAMQLFSDVDYVISPTVAVLPFPAGQHSPDPYHDDVTGWHRWCSFTYPWNLAGNPAISVPWTRTTDGVPIGMQIIGRHHDDLGVLTVAEEIEASHPWAADYDVL